jgi:hypothetical protein
MLTQDANPLLPLLVQRLPVVLVIALNLLTADFAIKYLDALGVTIKLDIVPI